MILDREFVGVGLRQRNDQEQVACKSSCAFTAYRMDDLARGSSLQCGGLGATVSAQAAQAALSQSTSPQNGCTLAIPCTYGKSIAWCLLCLGSPFLASSAKRLSVRRPAWLVCSRSIWPGNQNETERGDSACKVAILQSWSSFDMSARGGDFVPAHCGQGLLGQIFQPET